MTAHPQDSRYFVVMVMAMLHLIYSLLSYASNFIYAGLFSFGCDC